MIIIVLCPSHFINTHGVVLCTCLYISYSTIRFAHTQDFDDQKKKFYTMYIFTLLNI